jgi:hypothetical protein
MPRSLADYCTIYREWLLLLRGRLAQSGVDLPELFAEGPEGDEELMRFALCYNILQVGCSAGCVVCQDVRDGVSCHVWARNKLLAEGSEGDEELMRSALCYNMLQVGCRAVVFLALGVDLPELFAEGPEGDEELMRFALCYNILQVGDTPHIFNLRDAAWSDACVRGRAVQHSAPGVCA